MVLMSEWSVWLAMAWLSPFRRPQSRGCAHECLDMDGGGGCKRLEVVAAFQSGDELAAGMFRGGFEQLLGDPSKVRLDQTELRQRVPDMGVEAGGDEEKVRGEIVQGWQDAGEHRLAKVVAVVPRLQGRIEDVSDPRVTQSARAGKERHLVGRAIEQVLVRPERGLRAVAVMDIEIDYGDAFGAMGGAGMERGDRHRIEQAEAHG